MVVAFLLQRTSFLSALILAELRFFIIGGFLAIKTGGVRLFPYLAIMAGTRASGLAVMAVIVRHHGNDHMSSLID